MMTNPTPTATNELAAQLNVLQGVVAALQQQVEELEALVMTLYDK